MKDWLSRLGLLVVAVFFFFLCFGSLQVAINWTFLIGILGTFWAVSILISSVIAFIIFVAIVFVLLGIFSFSFIGSKEDVKTSETK
jgi:hypothetical protein